MHSLNKRGNSGALPTHMLGRGLFRGEVERSESQQWQRAESRLLFLLPSQTLLLQLSEVRNTRAASEQRHPPGKSSGTAPAPPCPRASLERGGIKPKIDTGFVKKSEKREVPVGSEGAARAQEAGTRGQTGFLALSTALLYCSFCRAQSGAQRDPLLPAGPARPFPSY